MFRIIEKLERLENKDLILPELVKIGGLGKVYNIKQRKNIQGVKYNKYMMFSASNILVLVYKNKEGQMFFEISPLYPWFYKKPKKQREFVSFLQFIENYKPYVSFCIDENIAQEWKKDAQRMYTKINVEFKKLWDGSRKA